MHNAVAGKRGLEAEGLSGIGANALRSPPDYITLFGQKGDQLRMRPGHVRAIFFHIEKRGGILAL